MKRFAFLALFALALAWAQFIESGRPELSARLELATEPVMPARVYLFKDARPFRLTPVQATLPLRSDLFYRDRLWRSSSDPDTLEVTSNNQSHFVLLKGLAKFDLPAGQYRVEAYRGSFFVPVIQEFELRAGEQHRVTLPMRRWASGEWISGDDHIHLTRSPEDDDVFLRWLEAEDLSVGNFLQLQRQMDAAVQYAFGRAGEAKRGKFSIRPGHESRSEFYGHVNLLGGREMIRPLSVGSMYANGPGAYPYPGVLFAQGRAAGATVGYAHFSGSMPHSTLLMDLVLGNIDFVEVFQFGVLKTEPWYELLNAGLRVTGIAGSDFPVGLNRLEEWPRYIPLLGPERTLVRADSGGSGYEAWADGVRKGNVVVTNGPLVDVRVDESGSNATASASFFRPLEKLEIISNGKIVASVSGDGRRTDLKVSVRLDDPHSRWIAARAVGKREENEPEILGHTNPLYVLREGKPVMVESDRETVARRWEAEISWYRAANLVFPGNAERAEFFKQADKALEELKRPLQVR